MQLYGLYAFEQARVALMAGSLSTHFAVHTRRLPQLFDWFTRRHRLHFLSP